MGFLDWVKGGSVVDLAEHSDIDDIFSALIADQVLGGVGGLGVAAVYRARQVVADTLSSLPVLAGDSLVPSPNGSQSWQGFLAETMLSLQDSGDAYWHVMPSGDMHVLPYQEMIVSFSEWNGFHRRRIYEFRQMEMRTEGVSKNLHVVHLNRGADDVTGLGWLESARIKGIIAIDEYSREYFENQAMPAGLLMVPREPTADEARLVKKQWKADHSTRDIGILPNTFEFKGMSFNPNDSQWVDSHLTSIGDVSNLSGVPAFLLSYNPPGSTQQYENVEALLIRLWRETLNPTYAARIESALSELLGVTIRFDPSSLFTTSLVNRADAASKLVGAGYEPADVTVAVGLPDMNVSEPEPVEVSDVVPV